MQPISITTSSLVKTKQLASKLAVIFPPPFTVALEGDLGAGKTAFVSGFIQSLKGAENIKVQSPTFALARTYPTTPIVHHLDLYRIDNQSSFEDLGIAELIYDPKAFVCIEWASKSFERLPENTLWIQIKTRSKNKREFLFHSQNQKTLEKIKNLI